jgi:hypothetical protein
MSLSFLSGSTPVRLTIAAVSLVTLAACGGSSSGASSSPTPTGTSISSTDPTAGSSSGSSGGSSGGSSSASSGTGSAASSTGTGCAPNGGKIPAGANSIESADFDHDGHADSLWLADKGTTRTVGVLTSAGTAFSTTFTSAAPQQARATGALLGDGSTIILLNTGRSVSLYAVYGCKIHPTANKQGAQYTFDLGFTGYGTGVDCVNVSTGLSLFGLNAKESPANSNRYNVYRTSITLQDFGASATNGTTVRTATGVKSTSAAFNDAHNVGCGSARSVGEPS